MMSCVYPVLLTKYGKMLNLTSTHLRQVIRCPKPNDCCNWCKSFAATEGRSAARHWLRNSTSACERYTVISRSLQAQGAGIEGEAGDRLDLRPGFMLPPLMFSEDEIAALVLGSRWVVKLHRRNPLQRAARNALAKIAAAPTVGPPPRSGREFAAGGPVQPIAAGESGLPLIRQAIRSRTQARSSTMWI